MFQDAEPIKPSRTHKHKHKHASATQLYKTKQEQLIEKLSENMMIEHSSEMVTGSNKMLIQTKEYVICEE